MKVILVALWLVTLAAAYGVGQFADNGPQTASLESFRSALAEMDPVERSYGLSTFVRNMTEDQLPEAIEAFEAGRIWLSQEEMRLFMLVWARYDAAGAFERVDAWTEGDHDMAQSAAMYAWAVHDPSGALEKLNSTKQRSVRRRLRTELVNGWTISAEKWALGEWLATLPDTDGKQRYVGALTRGLLRDGPEELIAWVESVPEQPDKNFKNLAALKAMNTLAHKHYLRAAQWIDEHKDQEYAQNAGPIVVRHWSVDDPKAALLWGLELSDQHKRNTAVGYSFGPWLDSEPEAAEVWLQAEAPSAKLDSAVSMMVRRTMPGSFEGAMKWTEKIEDPKKRGKSIIDVAQKWRASDAEAADAWMADADVSDEMRQEILEGPQDSGRRRSPGGPMQRRGRGRPGKRQAEAAETP
jgi:hypothetical protein